MKEPARRVRGQPISVAPTGGPARSQHWNALFGTALLRWQQVDLVRRTVRVGKGKTEAGTGRIIPLNDNATKVLEFWAEQFPDREPEHFVFPSERYGAGGDKFVPTVYDVDPARAINSWKRGVGVSQREHGCRDSFSRPPAYLRYENARGRRSAFSRGVHSRMESSDDRESGQALRPHRGARATTSGGDSRSEAEEEKEALTCRRQTFHKGWAQKGAQ